MVPNPLPLNRRHVLANKFGSPECPDYQNVAEEIRHILDKIRKGTLLAQADCWIRTKHYTAKRLEIERLSGTALSMDRCYINLAIIEQPGQTSDRSKERSEGDSATRSSPFSLPARLKVETPDKNIHVELPALFDPRKRGDIETKPRRILIRGRPGVGKTTLCKKIVYEFTCGTWSGWSKLFDRVLWVPLRRLKRNERLQQPGYNFFHLFNHEYFSPKGAEGLARALSDALDTTKSCRTLFLLDGLDEVSQDIGKESDMFRFLEELLNQPNVIITSRPSGKLPPGLAAIDIELETIGFYPNQVNEYLERVLPERANEVQSFLRDHSLLRDLVRVPIQLDALCLTWKNGFPGKFDTMTTIYRAIEDGLWKKDVLRLNKTHAGQPVTESLLQYSDSSEIKVLVKDEIHFLEGFAFAGLHNDIIDFEWGHQRAISKHLDPPTTIFPTKTLQCLSFLRTSDLSSEQPNRSYHFLHLTYQEYFAARYFVRQWQAKQPLICPVLSNRECQECQEIGTSNAERQECQKIGTSNFLQKHKYTARYDVFWRFVAGLFDAEGKGEEFFKAIEDKPRDLLGPTHQRLVMHCLSEASTEMPLRSSLEMSLKEWLVFECKFTRQARLASEVEFPERALFDALQESGMKSTIVWSLAKRPTLPSSIVNLIIFWLKDGESPVLEMKPARSTALQVLEVQSSLSDEHLTAVEALLRDQNWNVRMAALKVLEAQSGLSDERLTAVEALLRDEDWVVRWTTLRVLKAQSSLSDERLTAVEALLRDEHEGVRMAALQALEGQSRLSDERLTAVEALLRDEDEGVRRAALKVLEAQSSLSDKRLTAMEALLRDEDKDVIWAALHVLKEQSSLSDEHHKRLTTVEALLRDEDKGVRWAALKLLKPQSSLSDERLTVVEALLRDEDKDIRWAALQVLEAQSSLSDELLTAVVALLQDEDEDVGTAARDVLTAQSSLSNDLLTALSELLESESAGGLAEAILRGYREFYSTLFNGRSVGSLFEIFLRRSFDEQWSWHVEDGASYVNAPDGVRNAGIDDMKVFKDVVMKSWPRGIPSEEEKIW